MYGIHKMLAIFMFSKGTIGTFILIRKIGKRFTVIRSVIEGDRKDLGEGCHMHHCVSFSQGYEPGTTALHCPYIKSLI